MTAQDGKARAYATAIARYTKRGGNEVNGRALLNDLMVRFAAKNLPAALVYWGFATPPTADHLAAVLHGLGAATRQPRRP